MKRNETTRRLAALLALCLALALLRPAAPARAGQEGTVLYERTATASIGENRAAWPGNTGLTWMQTCQSEALGATFQQYCLYNNLTAANGVPEGERMTIEIPVELATKGYAEVCLSFQYGHVASNTDAEIGAVDQLQLYASTDGGESWSKDCVGIRSYELLGTGASEPNSDSPLETCIYRVECESVTGLVPEGAVIDRLMLKPYGSTYLGCYGATRIHSMTVTGYAEARVEPNVCDRVSFEGTGELYIDELSLDTEKSVYAPAETFSGSALSKAWSGDGELTALHGESTLRGGLHGKTISFFGDSISTYAGWTDNEKFNPTLGRNRSFYPRSTVLSPEDTWWLRTARLAGMEFLVNNSYSGDKLQPDSSTPASVGLERCVQLHGADGRTPDAIVIFFGTNDIKNETDEDFRGYYSQMLTGIRKAYPDAELFLCTIQAATTWESKAVGFNAVIRELAKKEGAHYIDLWNSAIRSDKNASIDRWVHPTKAGMAVVSELVLDSLSTWADAPKTNGVLRLASGREQYLVTGGKSADLIFDCKLAAGSAYTVRLGTKDSELAAVQLPLAGMQADKWYTVRVRYDRGQTEVTATAANDRVDPYAGQRLYYRMASSSLAENKTAWPANTGRAWMQTCVSEALGATFQQVCYYNNLTAADGIPAGEHMTIEIPVDLPTAGYEEICFSFQYGRMPGDNDIDLCATDKLELYASTDGGKTWSEDHVGIRQSVLADVGTTEKSGTAVENRIFQVECEDLKKLVPEGAVIDRLRLRPYGDYGPCYGGTRIHWMEVTGYETARPAAVDRVSFEGTGEMLVDELSVDVANRVYAPAESFNAATLPKAWSGKGEPVTITDAAALRAALHGKTVSVFGDSISSFAGWSNNTSFNPTVGGNACYYPHEQMPDAEQSWWLRTIRLAGMELLVNNSYSGDKLDADLAGPNNVGLTRCTQLDGADGRKPDVILVYFGTNDVTLSSEEAFSQNYPLMLSRMKAAYPKAELFLCSVTCHAGKEAKAQRYNAIISEQAAANGAHYVDLWNSELRSDPDATIDDGVHPTAKGMRLISELVMQSLADWAKTGGTQRAVRLTGGKAEYAVESGSKADLIFACKLAKGSSYTVRLGSEDSEMTSIQLPLDGMEADRWYTVRVQAKNGEVSVTSTDAEAEVPAGTPGDLSGDGKVNAKDVVTLQRAVAGGYGVTLDASVADLTGDGKVNAKDVVLLQRFVAGGYGVEL